MGGSKTAPRVLPLDVLEITERVAQGERLLSVLVSFSIPPLVFFKHLDTHPEDKLMFEFARRVATETLIDECNDIFDGVVTKTDLEVAKAKVGFRQWAAEKLIPATYGTKIQHDVSGTINIKAALGEADGRIAKAIESTATDAPYVARKVLPTITLPAFNKLPSDEIAAEFTEALNNDGPETIPEAATIKPEDLF